MLRLAAVVCSLAVLGVGAFDHGVAQQATVVIDVNETVGVSDSQQALPPASAGANESVDVTDAVVLVPPASIEVNESVSVADSQQAVPPAYAETAEGVQVSDSVAVVPPAYVIVLESITVTDQQRLLPPAYVTVIESLTVADTQRILPPVSIDVSETVQTNDALGDSDGDGTNDLADNCPNLANASQADPDADRIGSACDNCPATANGPAEISVFGTGNQTDSDGDGRPGTQPPTNGTFGGDACDVDDDNDGVLDTVDGFCRTHPEDYDGFEDGDGCPDADNDLDGICDPGLISPGCFGSDTGQMAFYPAGHNHTAGVFDCRNVAEDLDAFKDSDGCPEPDNDNDGFADADDQCDGDDNIAGPDAVLGSGEDQNHNGLLDAGEDQTPFDGVLTTDDVVLTFEDYDAILNTDGCHDSPGDDRDGDGFTDENEALKIGTRADKSCGNDGWPADLFVDGLSFNKLDLQDLGSFVGPVRRLGTSQGVDANYSARWDLVPGSIAGKHINISDLAAVVPSTFTTTSRPPMFGGTPAFGKVCPSPP